MDTKAIQEEIQRLADLERFAQDQQAEIKAEADGYLWHATLSITEQTDK